MKKTEFVGEVSLEYRHQATSGYDPIPIQEKAPPADPGSAEPVYATGRNCNVCGGKGCAHCSDTK